MAKDAAKDRSLQARQMVQGSEARSNQTARRGLLPRRIPFLYFLGGILFTVVAVTPTVMGVYPLPYTLGQIASSDIICRVQLNKPDDPDLLKRLALIKETHPRRYRYQPERYAWRLQMGSALSDLVTTAYNTNDIKTLLARPAAKSVGLTTKQAEVFLREIQATKNNRNPFIWVRDPPLEYMQQYIYPRGVMRESDYKREQGKEIQIATPNHTWRTVYVSVYPDSQGPLIKKWVRAPLNDRLLTVMNSYSPEFRAVIRDIVLATVPPSLVFDEAATNAAIAAKTEALRERLTLVKEGSLLVSKGQPIVGDTLILLRAEDKAFRESRGLKHLLRQWGGKTVLIFGLALSFIFIFGRLLPWAWSLSREVLGILVFACLLVTLANGTIYFGLPATILPLGLLAGVVALLVNARAGALAVTIMSLVLLVLLEGNPGVVVAQLVSGILFSYRVPTIRRQHQFISAAMSCGLLAAFLVITWGVSLGESPALTLNWKEWLDPEKGSYLYIQGFGALAGWLTAGIATVFSLPLMESVFKKTNAVRLQELQDQNHPCLRQMVVEAPGTYHHSILVSTLAEAAAEAIGADALLVKVGAYYHDIGKLMKPEYFSENESGISRHDSLSPEMSTLIIIAHVKDGAEMAREYGLPPRVIDLIQEHHGRDAIRYFYHKAKRQAESPDNVTIADFRYPGPTPQSREAGIMMLADSVEAACRAIDNPTAPHIRKLVHEILMDRLLDGQFSESGLTLTELHIAEETMIRILISMHHGRVKYPGQERGRRKR